MVNSQLGGRSFHLRAQSQPIWILIGLLLAMIIGILMYQIVGGALQKSTFDDMMQGIDEGTARIQITDGCKAWADSTWTIPPSNLKGLSDYAARLLVLSKIEWERKETFSKCDCAVYLYVKNIISRSTAEIVYDPEICHDWANTQAEELGIRT